MKRSQQLMINMDAKPNLGYHIANKLVFNKIKEALGIDKCHVFYTAGAPLNEDIKHFFSELDMMIREIYGSSETSCLGASSYLGIPMKVGKMLESLL